MSEKSYKTQKPAPVIDRATTFTKGWYRSLQQKVAQLNTELTGLKERVKSVSLSKFNYARYQEMRGLPAAYRRDFTLSPESAQVQVPAYLNDVSPGFTMYPFGVNQPANFIARSGQTYSIDLRMPGDGVFVAKFLHVEIYQRLFVPTTGPVRLRMYNKIFTPITGVQFNTMTKFAISQRDRVLCSIGNTPANRSIEFFWNMLDHSSGRRYADELCSGNFLLPPSFQTLGNTPSNGDKFDLGKPWIFERDSQLEFQFRPITDVFQLDPTSAILPHRFNDREVGNTVRNESITVRVELHGAKFLTKQDALKHGARFFEDRENAEVLL